MTTRIEIGNPDFEVVILAETDAAPRLLRAGPRGRTADIPAGQPLIEIVTGDSGHAPSTTRITYGELSGRLRYVSHEARELGGGWTELSMSTREAVDGPAQRFGLVAGIGIEAVLRLTIPPRGCALRSSVTVTHAADASDTRTLKSVASLALHLSLGPSGAVTPDAFTLATARNDWMGESRWSVAPLRSSGLEDLGLRFRNIGSRGHVAFASAGTWSTGTHLASGAIWNTADGSAATWQIEHNGGWRFDLAENAEGTSLALSGPTDDDHHWIAVLAPGESFTTVPVSIAFGTDLDAAVAAMTGLRRLSRRPHPDNDELPVVYNDYMNTLMGDPTTEKLIPLIDAAADAGAEYFVMDAGWYSDDDDWWATVGDWIPSTVRFPGGMGAVFDRIRDRGMRPGIWLEPELVGIDSEAARTLPPEAFFQSRSQLTIESERLHLDLRHPAARKHLDDVVDRLVAEFGIAYFKLDYNVNMSLGTDHDADSVGAGLLAYNRAHVDWLAGILDRHPEVTLENCGSGAMRADWALLSVTQLQSTSDQQEAEYYSAIAASAPFSMLPEQAANWAYPAADMTLEKTAFTLATGVLGRFCLSGFLDRLDARQSELTAEAVRVHKELRPFIRTATPSWPLGLDQREEPWQALAFRGDTETLLTLWRQEGAPSTVRIPLPALAGAELDIETIFPVTAPGWELTWSAADAVLDVVATDPALAARVVRFIVR
ncbi:Bifunctional alpha-galactosidase/sucrose kinase AgaSK [Microbacterium oleivorans]|uniref:glycoside hydrolase family 36 protein n=1 Tax=Microbacterium oleivorans TaxID=273677 RepID=UPI000975554D|nr:glycoside hydrolase family 36 protein [Microbacterium oleivorans]AZS42898.1 Bifunctional alpha-galactosidase/sucrose kinase AgaSK [Microbacterium oleivorans]